MTNTESKPPGFPWGLTLVGIFGVLVLWFGVGYWLPNSDWVRPGTSDTVAGAAGTLANQSNQPEQPDAQVASTGRKSADSAEPRNGVFGDQFGAVNALFSGMAFLGVIVALVYQSRELKQAYQEHKKAVKAHTSIVASQIVLNVSDDIRSQEWGKAHGALWSNARAATSLEQFISDYGHEKLTNQADIDQCRRVFMKPIHKLYRLGLLELEGVDDNMFRATLTNDIADTLHTIVLPMEFELAERIARNNKTIKSMKPLALTKSNENVRNLEAWVKKLHPPG